MNYKTKSFLYFASFMLAIVTYYNVNNLDTIQNTEIAENSIENVSTVEALN